MHVGGLEMWLFEKCQERRKAEDKTTGFAINFALKPLCAIVPWGGKHKSLLSWFGMTDSELWIRVGEQTIYEYSDAAREFWKCNIRYNDYQLSRFLEDFSEIFDNIRESIPEKYYNMIGKFWDMRDRWKEFHIDDADDVFDTFYDEELKPLGNWFSNRIFDSWHLIGGPLIGCFRCGERIKIWWLSDDVLENGENIWTSTGGVYELPYSDFTVEVNRFFGEFYKRMDEQVRRAIERNWREVEVDKTRLAEENEERKEGFNQKLALLSEDCRKTDWERIDELFEKMKKELSTGEQYDL